MDSFICLIIFVSILLYLIEDLLILFFFLYNKNVVKIWIGKIGYLKLGKFYEDFNFI